VRTSLAVLAAPLLLTQVPAIAAEPASRPKPAPAGPRQILENGYVQFANREAIPNTVYSIRGHLEVTYTPELIFVRGLDDGRSFVFPTQRLVYAGSKPIGSDAEE